MMKYGRSTEQVENLHSYFLLIIQLHKNFNIQLKILVRMSVSKHEMTSFLSPAENLPYENNL